MTLTETAHTSTDRFWSISKNGTEVGTLYHPVRAFAPWFVSIRVNGLLLSRSEFKSKAAALAYAGAL